MKIEVSAPGKVILHGEHAVVYGKVAIAASLSLRTRLTLVSHEDKVQLNLKSLGIKKEWDKSILNDYSFQSSEFEETAGSVTSINEDIIARIVSVFELADIQLESHLHAVIAFLFLWIYISKCYNNGSYIPCIVDVDSELGIGSGMGSSASYSVCLSAAMLVLCGRTTPRLLPEDKTLINEWAFQAERVFHGRPSGLDNSICLYGGAVLFSKGSVSEKLPNLPYIHVLLVNTKVTRNTKLLVENVKQKKSLVSWPFEISETSPRRPPTVLPKNGVPERWSLNRGSHENTNKAPLFVLESSRNCLNNNMTLRQVCHVCYSLPCLLPFPHVVESILESIEHVSNECWSLLTDLHSPSGDKSGQENLEKMQHLFNTNHHLLNALDVGHPKLDQIKAIAESHKCSCKITGAGGGGCAIVLLSPKTDEQGLAALKDELGKCDFDVHDVFLGCPGVQVEYQTL